MIQGHVRHPGPTGTCGPVIDLPQYCNTISGMYALQRRKLEGLLCKCPLHQRWY